MNISSSDGAIFNPSATTNLIIVMGVSGSGKSTLAQTLATRNNYIYLDGDDFHSNESRTMMANGIALTDIQREPWVANIKQRLEENAVKHLHTILAFSGLRKKHRDILRSAGLRTIFLFLNSDKRIIQDRLNHRENHFMAPDLLESQYESLENPTGEPDIYAIDVFRSREEVAAEAQNIIETVLFSR